MTSFDAGALIADTEGLAFLQDVLDTDAGERRCSTLAHAFDPGRFRFAARRHDPVRPDIRDRLRLLLAEHG